MQITEIPAQKKHQQTEAMPPLELDKCLQSIAHFIQEVWRKISQGLRDCFSRFFPETSSTLEPESDRVRMRKINQIIDLAASGVVHFYDKTNPITAFLGNFAPCKISVTVPQNDKVVKMKFLNAEAAYQACKFSKQPKLQEELSKLSGEQAWQFAQDHKHEADSHLFGIDWFNSSDMHMRRILLAKFSQNEHLKELLMATADAYLVEHTVVDTYWGDGGTNGQGQPLGKNRLGTLLMEVRKDLCGSTGVINQPSHYLQTIYSIETKNNTDKDKLCAVTGCAFKAKPGNAACHVAHHQYIRL